MNDKILSALERAEEFVLGFEQEDDIRNLLAEIRAAKDEVWADDRVNEAARMAAAVAVPPPVVAAPRVLIEVYGGVASYDTVGNVDVKLVDYDECDQDEDAAKAWLNAEPVPLTPEQSDVTMLRNTLEAISNDCTKDLDDETYWIERGVDRDDLICSIRDSADEALAGTAGGNVEVKITGPIIASLVDHAAQLLAEFNDGSIDDSSRRDVPELIDELTAWAAKARVGNPLHAVAPEMLTLLERFVSDDGDYTGTNNLCTECGCPQATPDQKFCDVDGCFNKDARALIARAKGE